MLNCDLNTKRRQVVNSTTFFSSQGLKENQFIGTVTSAIENSQTNKFIKRAGSSQPIYNDLIFLRGGYDGKDYTDVVQRYSDDIKKLNGDSGKIEEYIQNKVPDFNKNQEKFHEGILNKPVLRFSNNKLLGKAMSDAGRDDYIQTAALRVALVQNDMEFNLLRQINDFKDSTESARRALANTNDPQYFESAQMADGIIGLLDRIKQGIEGNTIKLFIDKEIPIADMLANNQWIKIFTKLGIEDFKNYSNEVYHLLNSFQPKTGGYGGISFGRTELSQLNKGAGEETGLMKKVMDNVLYKALVQTPAKIATKLAGYMFGAIGTLVNSTVGYAALVGPMGRLAGKYSEQVGKRLDTLFKSEFLRIDRTTQTVGADTMIFSNQAGETSLGVYDTLVNAISNNLGKGTAEAIDTIKTLIGDYAKTGLQDIADVAVDSIIQKMSFEIALRELYGNGDEFLRIWDDADDTTRALIKNQVTQKKNLIQQEMKGFSSYFGDSTAANDSIPLALMAFNFRGGWGFNMGATYIRNSTVPFRNSLSELMSTGDYRKAGSLFVDGLISREFLGSMYLTFRNAYAANKLTRNTDTQDDGEMSYDDMVEAFDKMSQIFPYIQAFQSSGIYRIAGTTFDYIGGKADDLKDENGTIILSGNEIDDYKIRTQVMREFGSFIRGYTKSVAITKAFVDAGGGSEGVAASWNQLMSEGYAQFRGRGLLNDWGVQGDQMVDNELMIDVLLNREGKLSKIKNDNYFRGEALVNKEIPDSWGIVRSTQAMRLRDAISKFNDPAGLKISNKQELGDWYAGETMQDLLKGDYKKILAKNTDKELRNYILKEILMNNDTAFKELDATDIQDDLFAGNISKGDMFVQWLDKSKQQGNVSLEAWFKDAGLDEKYTQAGRVKIGEVMNLIGSTKKDDKFIKQTAQLVNALSFGTGNDRYVMTILARTLHKEIRSGKLMLDEKGNIDWVDNMLPKYGEVAPRNKSGANKGELKNPTDTWINPKTGELVKGATKSEEYKAHVDKFIVEKFGPLLKTVDVDSFSNVSTYMGYYYGDNKDLVKKYMGYKEGDTNTKAKTPGFTNSEVKDIVGSTIKSRVAMQKGEWELAGDLLSNQFGSLKSLYEGNSTPVDKINNSLHKVALLNHYVSDLRDANVDKHIRLGAVASLVKRFGVSDFIALDNSKLPPEVEETWKEYKNMMWGHANWLQDSAVNLIQEKAERDLESEMGVGKGKGGNKGRGGKGKVPKGVGDILKSADTAHNNLRSVNLQPLNLPDVKKTGGFAINKREGNFLRELAVAREARSVSYGKATEGRAKLPNVSYRVRQKKSSKSKNGGLRVIKT